MTAKPPPAAVHVAGLQKSYQALHVLRGVDLDVPLAASSPCSGPTGRQQVEVPEVRELYRDLADMVDVGPDDPRLPELADRAAAFIEAAAAESEGAEDPYPVSDDLVELLDAAFLELVPRAGRLLELLEERGWTGWTMVRRVEPGRRV